MESQAKGATSPYKGDPDYRKLLVAAGQKSQDDFDKTVLSLSGGALAISFVFIKDIVGPGKIESSGALLAAWVFWAASSCAVLSSFLMSHFALREALRECDEGVITKQPGGRYSKWTHALNLTGAAAFILGVCFMAAFVFANISIREKANVRQKTDQANTPKVSAQSSGAHDSSK